MKRKKDAPASPDRAELEQQVETLHRDIRRLQLEKDVLKKANELLKNKLGIDRQHLTNQEKTQLVDALRQAYMLPNGWRCIAAAGGATAPCCSTVC